MNTSTIIFIIIAVALGVVAYYWFDVGYKIAPKQSLETITANPVAEVVQDDDEEIVSTATSTDEATGGPESDTEDTEKPTVVSPPAVETATNQMAYAYLAGGCFWCVEKDFEKLDATGDVVSGYSGGKSPNPTYYNHSDHREAVMVPYDPSQISYRELLHYFFRHHDGTDPGGSFYDRGHSYTSAIYYQTEKERQIAEEVKSELDALGIFEESLVTAIEPFRDFTIAEEYHQNYYKRDPVSAQKYRVYRNASGRDDFIQAVAEREEALEQSNNTEASHQWARYEKPSDSVLQDQLTPLEYKVTQKDGTEPSGTPGNLDDEKREGIFVDILSGEPLYSSTHKFDSGTGWPSFTQPIDMEFIETRDDNKLFYVRTEVRSKYADNHLGHVFNDGPNTHNGEPSTGQRWCMNGAALTFIPREEMEEKGYGDYLYLFN